MFCRLAGKDLLGFPRKGVQCVLVHSRVTTYVGHCVGQSLGRYRSKFTGDHMANRVHYDSNLKPRPHGSSCRCGQRSPISSPSRRSPGLPRRQDRQQCGWCEAYLGNRDIRRHRSLTLTTTPRPTAADPHLWEAQDAAGLAGSSARSAGPYTVRQAVDDYLEELEGRASYVDPSQARGVCLARAGRAGHR